MSRQCQCNLQAWAVAAGGNGTGADNVNDPPSLPSFPVLFFLLSPNFTTDQVLRSVPGASHAPFRACGSPLLQMNMERVYDV